MPVLTYTSEYGTTAIAEPKIPPPDCIQTSGVLVYIFCKNPLKHVEPLIINVYT